MATPTISASSGPTADPSDFMRHEPASSSLHCCCGRVDCAFLKKNCSVLEIVEKDVHTAAQLGQALLARHEAYMADAERDRLDLTSRIERLEMDKQQLEADNASKIEENRQLLDQLELLNSTVCDSDAKIKSLEASLLSSQQSIRQLENAAARAADAERHLAMLEDEQEQLHHTLQSSQEDARSHAQRCKEAQRGILDMQDQLERIESEARQERERHAEVVSRMERQREVDKQLDTAAGRLKGAAAATKSMQTQKNGNGIVNHFVRDLLQDNANLQLGIAELRELLMNSNDEIQTLREQLMYHQPMDQADTPTPTNTTLMAELEPHEPSVNPARLSQELHVHHHYHVTPKQDSRKSKKRRSGLLPGVVTPPNLSTPPTPSRGPSRLTSSPTAPALLSRIGNTSSPAPALSMLPSNGDRWADMSNPPSEFASSVPSSPLSNGRPSLFDHVMSDNDIPTSPSSYDATMSPTWYPSHSKRPSEASNRSFSFSAFASIDSMASSPPSGPPGQAMRYARNTIQEETEEEGDGHTTDDAGEAPELVDNATSTEDSATCESDVSRDDFIVMPRTRTRRANSQESIMSLTGGLDIHTLKARPSQMTLRPLGGVEAIVTGVTAQPTLSRSSAKRSDVALRDTFAGFQSPRSASGPAPHQTAQAATASSSPAGRSSSTMTPSGLGKWVGWRPWGGGGAGTPASGGGGVGGATTTNATPTSATAAARSASNTPSSAAKDRAAHSGRPTGINQAGSIPGFQQYWAAQKRKGAPAKVTTETVDRDALNEGLQG